MKKGQQKNEAKKERVCVQKAIRVLAMGMTYLCVLLVGVLGWAFQSLPDTLYIAKGEAVKIAHMPLIEPQEGFGTTDVGSTIQTGSYNTTLSLKGMIPLKTVRTVVTDRPVVSVCGTPFGIKILSEGALVVGFTDLATEHGQANPAKEAGLKLGDLIVQINEKPVQSNEDVSAAIVAGQGKPVTVVYLRDQTQCSTLLTPVKTQTGEWLVGMWARDSSAGVGTMTFVDEQKGVFAGLGHSISDTDTGKSVALHSGEIMNCNIIGYQQGYPGVPGELKGQFVGAKAIGSILINGECGLYGTARTDLKGTSMEVGFSQEIKLGKAEVWTTIDGNSCEHFEIEIEKISYADGNRDLVVKVTDPVLLEKTGGILQGMSGSPVLQNGKLIGAVTHVFVNDPTRGYGIFIENMLETAESIE